MARGSIRFASCFGDETTDYAAAQQRHYNDGAPADWAEPFRDRIRLDAPLGRLGRDVRALPAHGGYARDSASYGLALKPDVASGAPIPNVKTRRLHFDDFDELIAAWFPLTNALNSLNRSMGLADLYPFVLSEPAIEKLRFVHDVVAETSREGATALVASR